MKLKEQAIAAIAKGRQAEEQGDPCREEKPLPAEAEVNETFEGEMDNFQTPLVRDGPSAPFFLRNSLLRGVSLFVQLSSLVPLVRLALFHSLARRKLMALLA